MKLTYELRRINELKEIGLRIEIGIKWVIGLGASDDELNGLLVTKGKIMSFVL